MSLKNKIIPTVIVVVVMVTLISIGGYAWITHSPVYALAENQIAAQKNQSLADSKIKFAWWKSWRFSDDVNGYARFAVCDTQMCYLVVASKQGGSWKIDSLSPN
jgi:hypothetical protein